MKWRQLKELIKEIPEEGLDSTVWFSYDIMVHGHYSNADCLEGQYSGEYPDKPTLSFYLGKKESK